eukprot:TRINITY_DN4032_c0_g1_i1.p1 TRINITY_DN4032_c0_g1~~TRINITY_DN4032_c0_g1_i1.p1  ORF type:complete len:615 (+),score=160.62 TRINITY_DN4032_c0_g1_i1:178-1845(+)
MAAGIVTETFAGRSFADLLEPGSVGALQGVGMKVPTDREGAAVTLGDYLLSELRTQLPELQRQKADVLRLRCRLQEAESERDAHKALLVRHRSDAQQARKESRAAAEECKRLQSALDRELREKEGVSATVDQLLQEDRAARRDEIHTETAQVRRSLVVTAEQLQSKESEIDSLHSAMSECRSEVQKMKSRLARVTQERDEMSEDMLQLRERECDLQDKLAATLEDAQVLRERIDALQRPPPPPEVDEVGTARVRIERIDGVVGCSIDGSPPTIQEIFRGGAAEKAGLRQGMTVEALDGVAVQNAAELADCMRRAGVRFTLKVKVPPGMPSPPRVPLDEEFGGEPVRSDPSSDVGIFGGALPDADNFQSCQDALDCASGGWNTVEMLAKCVRDAVVEMRGKTDLTSSRRGSVASTSSLPPAPSPAALRTAQQEGNFALALCLRLHHVLWWVEDCLRGVRSAECRPASEQEFRMLLNRQGRELRALTMAGSKAREAVGMLRAYETLLADPSRERTGLQLAGSTPETRAGPLHTLPIDEDYFAPLPSVAAAFDLHDQR